MYIDKVEELAKKIYGVKITKNPLGRPMYEFTGTELAMFAELIVRECAAMTRNLSPHGELAERAVKEHFGVEE